MNPPFRLALCAVLCCAGVWTGCTAEPSTPPPDAPPDTPYVPEVCQVDQDCPDPGLFFCDTATSRCQAACRTQNDCTAEKRGNYRIAACDENPLGCRCDSSRCVQAQCSADAECQASGRVCRDGRCEPAPSASEAAACQVTPDFVVGREGTSVRFSALAMDAAGKPVVVPSGVAWTALEASVRGGGTGGGESTFVLSAPTDGAFEGVRARVGSATCTARVRVLGAVAAGRLRAVVTDELTGRPVAGAAVVVADAAGEPVETARTDAGGVATLGAPGAVGSVSVFHADFDYLTLAHEGEAGPRDLMLPLRRNPTDRYGGTQGTFRNVSTSQDLHTGLVGLSAPDAVSDLSASLLVGPTRQVRFSMGGQEREATLPSGTYVVLPGSTLAVTDVSARGLAGVCGTEADVVAGACGTRAAWALGGDVPLSALSVVSGGGVDVGQLLAQTLPLLRTFSSSVVRDVRFGLEPTPGVVTGTPDLGNMAHFTRVDHDFQAERSMTLGFQFALRVPALPRYRGVYMDSVAVLGAARVPGRGVVPLGMGAGTNTSPVDPNTDTQVGLPGPGLVSVRMAPTHHGLEGSPYELLVTASSSTAANDATAGAASSVLIHRTLEQLPFDPRGLAPVGMSGSFLPVPERVHYNYNREGAAGLAGRQLLLTPDPELPPKAELPPGAVLRAVFTQRSEHHWNVLMDVSRATTGVRLPLPPESFEDRTYFGDLTGSRASLGVQALVLSQTGTPSGAVLTLRGLVEAEGGGLARLGALTTGWSSLDYGRARVDWVDPAQDGQSLARGAKVKVRVRAFRVGSSLTEDQGSVRLDFVGGTGCEGAPATGGSVADARGEVELTLPAGCSGTGVQVTATLVDTAGTAVKPPVRSTRTLTLTP